MSVEWCLDYLDELNSESQSTYDPDIYHNINNAKIEFRELKLENEQLKNQIKQYHIDLARFAEATQKELKEEIKKQYYYIDKIAEKVDQISDVIKIHKKEGQ